MIFAGGCIIFPLQESMKYLMFQVISNHTLLIIIDYSIKAETILMPTKGVNH